MKISPRLVSSLFALLAAGILNPGFSFGQDQDLFGHWPLDEAGGCSVFDASGAHEARLGPGCPANAPVWVEGARGGALHFDGSDDVVVSDAAVFERSNHLTVSAWIDHDGGRDWKPILEHRRRGKDGYALYLDRRSRLYMRVSGRRLYGSVVPSGLWVHVAGVYNGSELVLYVDGAEVARRPMDLRGIVADAPVRIGGHYRRARTRFKGRLDDLRVYRRALDAAAIAALAASDGPDSEPSPGERPFSAPLSGLVASEEAEFASGLELFERRWREQDGLGPQYNEYRCAECHRYPDVGGTSKRLHGVFYFGARTADGFDALEPDGGPVLQYKANPETPTETLPPSQNVVSLRQALPMYGLGLIEAIPDAAILSLADPDDTDGNGVSGRAALDADGRVLRFGWQAEAGSIHEVVGANMTAHLGVTEGEAPELLVDQLTSFVRYLAPFPRGPLGLPRPSLRVDPRETDPSILARGEAVFHEIGCADCHQPRFVTHSTSFTPTDGRVVDVAVLRGRTIEPYSDFLLHDLGPGMDDGVALGRAGSSEYRTAPLWGLLARVGNLLHDGRAQNIDQAMFFHGGEASRARTAYRSLGYADSQALTRFLRTL